MARLNIVNTYCWLLSLCSRRKNNTTYTRIKSLQHNTLASHLYTNKIEATFTSLGVVTIMTMIISSITILYTEDVPHGNIKNAEDALWWTVTTVTTVGYGDLYPVTRMGRIISVLLMLSGITMFSSITAITALIASYFVKEMK